MKLKAKLNGKTVDLDFRRNNGLIFANVDGREYELEASQPEPEVYLLKHKNCVFEVFIDSRGARGGAAHVRIGSDEIEISILDTKRLTGTSVTTKSADGIAEVTTPMPGKLVELKTQVGARVGTGDELLVIEAMKMQNVMTSPKDGMVKEIKFTAGDAVNAGDVLMIIE